MKALRLTLLILLSLVLARRPASAYYDPGVQRWITRDPIGEPGAVNLYTMVHNSPAHSTDLHGLWPLRTWLKGACGLAVGVVASKIYFKSQADTRHAHCMVSCKIATFCGRDTAVAAGIAKEFYDFVVCAYQGLRTGRWDSPQCYSAFQRSDFEDNAHGIRCPDTKSCAEQCKSLKGAPEAEPGPFYQTQ